MPEPFGEPFLGEIEDRYVISTAWIQEAQQEELLTSQLRKEVAVKDSDATRKGQFSRVLAVEGETGRIIFPEEVDPPKSGSATGVLRSKPLQFKEAIRATFRIDASEKGNWFSGTGFALSPSLGLTCYHVCSGRGYYRGIPGSEVRSEIFSFPEKARYHLEHVTGSPDTAAGADGALVRISHSAALFPTPEKPTLKPEFGYFLLPCSPTYFCGIGIVSYPGITNFLLRAHGELIDGVERNSIWDTYKEAMKEELEDMRVRLERQRLDVSLAERMVEKVLYRKLMNAFCSHSSGAQTVSLGTWNESGVGLARTTCSTLFGSSGGPVCSFETSGYFSGWLRGAADDYLANEAGTCDDPWFVATYFRYVLEDLPAPCDKIWEQWDMGPFFRWIQKHKAGQQVRGGKAREWTDSDWYRTPKRGRHL